MMTNDQDAHLRSDDAEQEMKRKFLQIHSPEITLSNTVGFRRFRGFLEKGSQLRIEVVRELWASHILVIIHDTRDVGRDLPMKLQAH